MKNLFFAFVMFLIMSCQSDKPAIEGTWIQPIPGQSGMQGICLEKGGKASSVHMYTLVYKTWIRHGEKLILSGESIGNRQTFSFTDTLAIQTLTTDRLVLKKGEYEMAYTRDK